MADGVNTEISAITQKPQNPNSRSERFRGWLKNFGRRTRNIPNPEMQDNPESQPPKPINELLGIKEAVELKPAQNILFHTAPLDNLDKLRLHGLFAQKDDPNLGINLGYSTFFATEHHMKRTGQTVPFEQTRTATPDDYVLTVWKKNSASLKTKGYFKDKGFYQPSLEPSPGPALDTYINAAIAGNQTYAWFGDFAKDMVVQDARMVPPEFLVEAVQLDKNNRDLITKNMVMAEAGIVDADQIEQSLQGILSSRETAHAVTASIEQNLIRNSVMPQINLIKEQTTNNPELSTIALVQAMLLRTKVNDRVSALYLDKSITWLSGKLKEAGLDPHKIAEENANKIREFNQNPQTIKPPVKILDVSRNSNYYGSDSTSLAASDIKRELKIAV
jgi:hypothetical protein